MPCKEGFLEMNYKITLETFDSINKIFVKKIIITPKIIIIIINNLNYDIWLTLDDNDILIYRPPENA